MSAAATVALLWLLGGAATRGQPAPVSPLRFSDAAPDPSGLERRLDEESSVLDALGDVDQRLIEVEARLLDIEAQVTTLEESRRRHEEALRAAEARTDRQRGELAVRVNLLYRLHKRGLARAVFGAQDPTALRRQSVYLLAVVRAGADQISAFRATLAEKKEALSLFERDAAAISALRAELQLQEASLRDERARRLEVLGRLRSQRSLAVQAYGELGVSRSQLGHSLSRSPGEVVSAPVDPSVGAGFRDRYGKLSWPVSGRLTSRFGRQVNPRTGAMEDHTGIGISADYGVPVRVVHEGVVRLADYVRGYGQSVAVQHGDYTTVYAHLNSIRVRQGAAVGKGDVIGLVGNTGLTDDEGYVLGFEVLYNGTRQDPLSWLSTP
jgi:septal ring factor EnvC (AmiA/AmiB activator)